MPTLDINNDGYISREEAAADPHLHSRFSEADRDRDDRLSHSETLDMQAAPPAGAGASAPGASSPGGSPSGGATQ